MTEDPLGRKSKESETESSDPLLELLRPFAAQGTDSVPPNIKRYRIEKRIGAGAFGNVFLATDDQLQRKVAIKVPQKQFLNEARKISRYLDEARTIARLDHPNIVPIYDVGSSYDFPCFIVTKFIDGWNLAERHQQYPLSVIEAIELIIEVADALHFAHAQGVVHRDVKPANILIDKTNKPFVVDLGLAIREDSPDQKGTFGTPAYMSPEQARGEGHRIDGRSDIFSLGVVLYELLAGKLPFTGKNSRDLLASISRRSAKPLRQFDKSIPVELERICMTAIAHRAPERFTTAHDFARELEFFLQECDENWLETVQVQPLTQRFDSGRRSKSRKSELRSRSTRPKRNEGTAEAETVPIIPKGFRHFDSNDAGFFPRLLPGPYDKHGMPQSIRFWKSRCESAELAAETPIGIIYGPSGCGKSSLIRAGLIPNLTKDIEAITIDATSGNTETDLLTAIRTRFQDIHENSSLNETLLHLQEKAAGKTETKTLLIIDQFEQFLNQEEPPSGTQLVQALKHCDGINLQCLLLVRDEFWLSLSRFSRCLEIKLTQGRNLTLVDLFPKSHARNVLHYFGNAFGKLPNSPSDFSKEDNRFLDHLVNELGVEERVSCVQLALVTQVLADKPWNLDTLKKLGGFRGLGIAFLESTFEGSPSPFNRQHAPAAARLLRNLLPSENCSLKGNPKTESELKAYCGYENHKQAFDQLLNLLDKQTQIISATDLQQSKKPERHFQITHDYLVPIIREWLRAKQQNNAKDLARGLLEEKTQMWVANPDKQRLPSSWETMKLTWYCPRDSNTQPQNSMLSCARNSILKQLGMVASFLAIIVASAGWYINSVQRKSNQSIQAELDQQALSLVETIETTSLPSLPILIERIALLKDQAIPYLRTRLNQATDFEQTLIYTTVLANFDGSAQENLIPMIESASDIQLEVVANTLNGSDSESTLKTIHDCFTVSKTDRTRAIYALLAMSFGDPTLCSKTLKLDSNPNDRSQTIVRAGLWRQNWQAIHKTIMESTSPDLISGLVLTASQVTPGQIPKLEREQLIHFATKTYERHPSAIVHAACRHLLRSWNRPIPDADFVIEAAQWKPTQSGLTMVKIPVAQDEGDLREFSIPTEPPQVFRLGKDFWISDSEISGGLFYEFLEDSNVSNDLKIKNWAPFQQLWEETADSNLAINSDTKGLTPLEMTASSPLHPIRYICLLDAIKFCNWLSLKEGLEPAYQLTGNRLVSSAIPKNRRDEFFPEFVLVPTKSGFRLPAMSQWQFARLANASTKFGFGTDLELIEHFGVWSPPYPQPRTSKFEPCGSKLPNNFGLFDINGNASEVVHSMVINVTQITTSEGEVRETLDNSVPQHLYGLWCGNGSTTWANISTHADMISFQPQRVSVLVDRRMEYGFRVALPAQSTDEPSGGTDD